MTVDIHSEAALLAAMASATTLAAQREYGAQLESLRAAKRTAARAAAEVDLTADYLAHLSPTVEAGLAPSYMPHTAATDWLAEIDVDPGDTRQVEASARAEATVWFSHLDPGLRSFAEEVRIQAQGMGTRYASQHGAAREHALAAYVSQVEHLLSRQAADVQAPPYQVAPAPVDYSVKDNGSMSDDAPSASGAADPKTDPATSPSLSEGDSPEGGTAPTGTNPATDTTHDQSAGNGAATDYIDGTSTPYPGNSGKSASRDEWGLDAVVAEDQSSDDFTTPSLAEGGPVEGDGAQPAVEDQPGGLSTSDHVADGGNAEAVDSIDGTVYPKQSLLALTASVQTTEPGRPFLTALQRLAQVGPQAKMAGLTLAQVAGFLAPYVADPAHAATLRSIAAGDLKVAEVTKTAGDTVEVSNLPECDVCKYNKGRAGVPAAYDAKLVGLGGSWGNVCEEDFQAFGPGRLGTGYAQRLVERKQSSRTAAEYGGGSPKEGDTATCHADDKPIQFFDGAWYHLRGGPSHNDVYPATPRERAEKTSSRYDGITGVPGSSATCKNCGGGLTAASGSGVWLHDKNGTMYCPGKDAPSETDLSFMDYVAKPENIREADGKGGWKESARTAADAQTCSVCGDKIAKDPSGEDNATWHHDNGEKHDHEAKPSGKESAKVASAAQDDCPQCSKEPGYHANLHAGHVWTNTSCPAYKSLDGDDCTCGGKKSSSVRINAAFAARVQASLVTQAADSDSDGLYTYVAMWRGKRAEIKAKTTLEAQRKAAEQFGAKKSYEVDVMLAQRPDGSDVVHAPMM